jgi:hypothetical protein
MIVVGPNGTAFDQRIIGCTDPRHVLKELQKMVSKYEELYCNANDQSLPEAGREQGASVRVV